MRATKAIIDLKAIEHNLSVVKTLAPHSNVMAVLKANAYGHGLTNVARAIPEQEAIAVACMDEAEQLRESGVNNEIVLLEGFFSEDELQQILELNLQTVIHQDSQVSQLEELSQSASLDAKIIVWLKYDSGMNRLGFDDENYFQAYERIKELPVVQEIRFMSHLACADDIQNPMTSIQLRKFSKLIAGSDGVRSLANSAGVIAWPETHFEWVRPGIVLFGCSPLLGVCGEAHQLKPAMTLQSQLFAIKHLEAGETVGYGASWQSKSKTRIGVIAIGYGDGYPRHAKEGTPVLINGKEYPLVGKVSMDMMTVDLGLADEFQLGDIAVLWGQGLPVEKIALFADTIPYTLFCGVTSRVKFEWHD